MQEFKHMVYDGRLEELDVLVKPIPADWPWKPVPDVPSTIDPNVTVEDCMNALERSLALQQSQFDKLLEQCPELAVQYKKRTEDRI